MAQPIITPATLAQANQAVYTKCQQLGRQYNDEETATRIYEYVVHRMANPHLHETPWAPQTILSFTNPNSILLRTLF